jgi:hypothetical protein
MNRRRIARLVNLAAVAVLLVACSTGASGETAAPSGAEAGDPSRDLLAHILTRSSPRALESSHASRGRRGPR